MGYSDYIHYKLYNIKLRRTIWTRDIVILEGKFLDAHPKDIPEDTKARPIDLDPTRAIPRSIGPTKQDKFERPILRSQTKQARIDASPSHKIEV